MVVTRSSARRATNIRPLSATPDFIKDPAGKPLTTKSGKFEITCGRRPTCSTALVCAITNTLPILSTSFLRWATRPRSKTERLAAKRASILTCCSTRIISAAPIRSSITALGCVRRGRTLSFSMRPTQGRRASRMVTPFVFGRSMAKCYARHAAWKTLCRARLAPHGSWVRVNEETGIDEGGADNYLTGNDISGGGVTSYNNNNCNFEKYDGRRWRTIATSMHASSILAKGESWLLVFTSI